MPDSTRPTEAEMKSVAEVKARWDDAVNFYRPWHDLIGKELAFTIDQKHYHDDNETDPQRIKPADPALLNQTRYKAAQILKASRHYEMRPVDNRGDPAAAAAGKALLDQSIRNPDSEFEDSMEDVVDGGLAASIWALEVGFDPDCGLHGELSFESRDPRKVTWTPGFKSPNGRRCPWITIEKQMLPEEIKRMGKRGWKNTDDVMTDAAARSAQLMSSDSPYPISGAAANSDASSEVKYTTVLFHLERFVEDMKPTKAYRALDPGDYHMWCPNETCGFKGMPQSQLDQPLPDGPGDPCPVCGTITQRATVEPIEKEVLAYKKGQRLRIIAPIAAREFWNDAWEYDMAGFPVLVYAPYNHPLYPIPHSDTYYYRSLVCVSDAMLRLGYEQMRKAHGIILAPQDSLFDAYGEPFPFSEHRDVAYYDNDYLAPGAIQWFQAPGLNAAWSTYFQTVQGVFAANKGTGQVGLTPQQSKDIAVGTIRTLVETGDIPVDRHIARFQRFRSQVLTRAFEIMRSTMTTERAVRIRNEQGVSELRGIRASGLPGFDVVVTAEPTIAQEELDKFQALEQLAQRPPYVRRFMARAVGLDPQILAEFEEEERKFAETQKAGAPPPAPGNNGGSPPQNGNLTSIMSRMGAPQ